MSQKRVIIIGGSSGIGLASALLLKEKGYEVAIAGRFKEKLESAKAQLGKAETYILDVTKEKEVSHFFSAIKPFHHLVISAAGFTMGPFLEMELSEAKSFFDSKFWGQYMAAKYGAKKIEKGGSITFFSGILGQKPSIGLSVASAINGAVESLTRALALELAPVRVNAISPGTIETPVWDIMPEKDKLSYFRETGQKLPAGRVGKPKDIAQAVLFLIECGYVTGDVLCCDGGKRFI